MDIFLQGLIQGGIYATATLGMALAWAVAKVMNLSHGAFLMLGSYLVYFGFELQGWNLPMSIFFALIVLSLFSAFIYRLVLHHIRGQVLTVLLVTLVLGLILEEVVRLVFGSDFVSIPSVLKGTLPEFFGATISFQKLMVLGVTVAAVGFLWLVMMKTRWGLAMRATVENEEGALLCGINTTTVATIAMALAGLMAALGGVLIGSTFYLTPTMGVGYIAIMFAVMVVAGLGSIWGVVVAAFILATSEVLGANYLAMFGGGWFRMVLFTVAIVLVLVVKPSGIFGREEA